MEDTTILLDLTVGMLPPTRIVVRELPGNELTPFVVTTDTVPTPLSATYCPDAFRVSRVFLAHLMAIGLPKMEVDSYFRLLGSKLARSESWRRGVSGA